MSAFDGEWDGQHGERRDCVRCAEKTRSYSWASDPYCVLNSRTGVWHIEHEGGYGKTECGVDATAEHWRWPDA